MHISKKDEARVGIWVLSVFIFLFILPLFKKDSLKKDVRINEIVHKKDIYVHLY